MAEKGRDVLGLNTQHRLADQLFIQRLQCGGGTEHQVGGVFDLHQAPVRLSEHVEHRTVQCCVAIEHTMQQIRDNASASSWARCQSSMRTNALSAAVNADSFRRQLTGQPTVTVAELQAERCPGGDA